MTRGAAPTIIDVLRDPAFFAGSFPPATWGSWTAALKGLFALPLTRTEREIFTRHTGRQVPPTEPAKEGWFVAGRRGGKSRVAAAASSAATRVTAAIHRSSAGPASTAR